MENVCQKMPKYRIKLQKMIIYDKEMLFQEGISLS